MSVGSPEGKGGEHDSSFFLAAFSLFSELRSCLDDDEMRSAGWCAPLIWVAGYLARNSAKLILLLYTTLTICTHEKKVSDPKYFDIIVIKYLL